MKKNGKKELVNRAFVLGVALLLALVSMSGCLPIFPTGVP